MKLFSHLKLSFILSFFACFVLAGFALANDNLVIKDEIIQLTNQERQQAGLGELKEREQLNQAAEKKAVDMLGNDYFAHTSPDGIDPWHWFEEVDYQYKYAGENLAMDFSTATAVTKAWMKSPSHKDNILSPKFTEIGVAVATGIIDQKETRIAVQLFGNPIGQTAAVISDDQVVVSQIEEASVYPWQGSSDDELLVYAKVNGQPDQVEAIIGGKSYFLKQHRPDTYMELILSSDILSHDLPVQIKAVYANGQEDTKILSDKQVVWSAGRSEKEQQMVVASAQGNRTEAVIAQFFKQNVAMTVGVIFFVVIMANVWVMEKEEENLLSHAKAS